MSIKHDFLFDHNRESQDNAPSSSDGSVYPAAVWPDTGEDNPLYRPVPVRPVEDPSRGLDTDISRQHGDVAAYRVTSAQVCGIDHDAPSDITSAGMIVDRSGPDAFSTTGSVQADGDYESSIVGDRDELTTRDARCQRIRICRPVAALGA
jgi:hypothetical protein